MNRIIAISNIDTNQYFFTTDHCQSHGMGCNWVPCTYPMPMNCTPREGVEDGIIDTVEKWRIVFGGKCCIIGMPDNVEIPNPDPSYRPDYAINEPQPC